MNLEAWLVEFVSRSREGRGAWSEPGVGRNGPYGEHESGARTHAHWLMLAAYHYQVTGSAAARAFIERVAASLVGKRFRPHGYSFQVLRVSPGKDLANGLVGQAWVIEALAAASESLGDDAFAGVARDVALQHRFDDETGLWYRRDVDGYELPRDAVFNHQLWFCAASFIAAKRTRDRELLRRVERFMERVSFNCRFLANGLIEHDIASLRVDWRHRLGGIRKHVRYGSVLHRLRAGGRAPVRHTVNEVMVGYHAFNHYAFSMLWQAGRRDAFFSSLSFRESFEFLRSTSYREQLEGNPFGYGYNAPGFAVPFCLAQSPGSVAGSWLKDEVGEWIARQWDRTYAEESSAFLRNTPDAETLNARVYELVRVERDLLRQVPVPG